MLNDDIGESRARQSGHSRMDQTWPNKILCSLGFFYNRLINRKNFHVIILKEAMNMNAAQHCAHNVFVFPSNREYPKIVSRSRISFERPQSMPNLVQDQ